MARLSDLMPDHTGLNLADLEQSIAAYDELLELKVIQESMAGARPCRSF